jgi:hypothetical protein
VWLRGIGAIVELFGKSTLSPIGQSWHYNFPFSSSSSC